MDGDAALRIAASLLILFANAFFVAAEYALIGCRKSSLDALARKGNRLAKRAAGAMADLSKYVAGIQIAITMCGIGAGAVTEPFVTDLLSSLFGPAVDRRVGFAVALITVTFFMVVIGELVPKYLTLNRADRVVLAVITPLSALVWILSPFVWLIERTGTLILAPFGVRVGEERSAALPKEELLLLVKAQSAEGVMEDVHAQMVSRALQLDKLDANDIMIHRMDIRWLDLDTAKDRLFEELAAIPHSRIPVCRGDIDDVAGILYLHDVVRHWNRPGFSLEAMLRPVVAVPENLSMDKLVERMRDERCQILIVVDEYGGTSGMITLEDVVEEIFGELEDRLETERPPIEAFPGGRVSARGEVRFDELVSRLGIELPEEPSTDTLASQFVNSLERVPRLGDTVETPLGLMRIENMARRRITRVSIQLSQEYRELSQEQASAGGD